MFSDVLATNADYVSGFGLAGLKPRAARGLAVLTCMDSRIEPLAMLGLVPGDARRCAPTSNACGRGPTSRAP